MDSNFVSDIDIQSAQSDLSYSIDSQHTEAPIQL